MKNINHPTESKLKHRLKEHEFDFDPQAWKSMNKMLNQHNPRRSPLWLSSLVAVTVAITLLSVAWNLPSEPIQNFLEKTFDFKKEIIKEKPSHTPDDFLNKKIENIEFQQTIPVEKNNTPTIDKNKKQHTPLAHLPEPSIPLLQPEAKKNNKENELIIPIASISSFLENKKTGITPVDLPLRKKVRAGFFGGGTVTVSGSPLTPQGAISPSIGVFAGYNINDKWSIQAEVSIRKGFIQPFTPKAEKENFLNVPNAPIVTPYDKVIANQDVIAKNLTVLEFPILAKYKLNEKNSVMAGVRPSWIHIKNPDSDSSLAETSHTAIYKKLDLGISVGYELKVTKKVAVNLRYNQGLTDLFEEEEAEPYYNNDFQASIRYSLNP